MNRCCRCDCELAQGDIFIGEDDNEKYCQDCYYDNYRECGGCGNWHHIDNMYYSERNDCDYCENCWEEDKDMTIRDYHDRDIALTFKKSTNDKDDLKLFYGFELEVENDKFQYDNNDIAYDIREKHEDLELCFEHDGSLDDGFEIISQPMSYNYISEHMNDFKDILNYLENSGFKSHNGGHCGLHVHISRDAFGEDEDTQDKNINKLLLFTETYKNELRLFSRRTDFHYCNFLSDIARGYNNDRFFKATKILKEENKNHDRYQAINTENSNTIEIRIFRGTLKYETFKATLDFVDNLMNVILNNSISKISWDKVINYNKTKELEDYVNSRSIFNGSFMVDESKNIEKDYEKRLEVITNISKQYNNVLMSVVGKVQDFCEAHRVDFSNVNNDNYREIYNNAQLIKELNNKMIDRLDYFAFKKNVKNFKDVFATDLTEFNSKINRLIDDFIYIIQCYCQNEQEFVEELRNNRNSIKINDEGEI